MFDVCVHFCVCVVCINGFRIVRPDPFYLVSSPRAVTAFLKSGYTKSTNDKSLLKSVRAAAEFITPTSRVQKCRSTTDGSPLLPPQLCSWGMMQKRRKHEASSATRWPSGRGLPTPQRMSGAEAKSQRSCQLREWEREAGGASGPVPAPGKSGRLLGCLA